MEDAIAEKIVSEALEYTKECIRRAVERDPRYNGVKRRQQEVKDILEDCIQLDTLADRDERCVKRMEESARGLVARVGEVVADVNSSSLLRTAIQGIHQDLSARLQKSIQINDAMEKENVKVERDLVAIESRVSVLEDTIRDGMRQHQWQQGQIRHLAGSLGRVSRIPRLVDTISDIEMDIKAEEDRIRDCSQCLIPLAHCMIAHAHQEEEVWDAKIREYDAQVLKTTEDLNEMRLYMRQIGLRGFDEYSVKLHEVDGSVLSPSQEKSVREQYEDALERLLCRLQEENQKLHIRGEDLVYAQMIVTSGIQQMDAAIVAVEHEIDAGSRVLSQLEREYECICKDINGMHAFCVSVSAISPDTRDMEGMRERKHILQDTIRRLKEDIVHKENAMCDRLLQYQSLEGTLGTCAAEDASNTKGAYVVEADVAKTTSRQRMTEKIQSIARKDAKEAHAVQIRLPRLVSSMVSRIGSKAAQL